MIDILPVSRALGYVTVSAGTLLFAIAALGLVRFPDVYTRLSAVTKAATLGVCLVLLGVLLIDPSWRAAVPLLLAIALQLITSPVGGYALGRAAYHAGVPLNAKARYNELINIEDIHQDKVSGTRHRRQDDEPTT